MFSVIIVAGTSAYTDIIFLKVGYLFVFMREIIYVLFHARMIFEDAKWTEAST